MASDVGIADAGTLEMNEIVTVATYSDNLSSITTGGTFNKTGTGILGLGSNNLGFTGTVNVQAGTLRIASATNINNDAPVTILSGATLDIRAAKTLGSIAGAGNIDIAGTFALTVGGDNTSTSFSGIIN